MKHLWINEYRQDLYVETTKNCQGIFMEDLNEKIHHGHILEDSTVKMSTFPKLKHNHLHSNQNFSRLCL